MKELYCIHCDEHTLHKEVSKEWELDLDQSFLKCDCGFFRTEKQAKTVIGEALARAFFEGGKKWSRKERLSDEEFDDLFG